MRKILFVFVLFFCGLSLSAQNDTIHIGDYYYSDGTVSSTRLNNKYCVGIVFSLQTSPAEKAYGWTHGQLVALEDAENIGKEWGRKDHLYFPYKRILTYAECVSDRNGYLNCISDMNSGNFYDAFSTASNFYRTFLPEGKTSGWYLPSVGQWIDIVKNIGKVEVDSNGYFVDKVKAQGNLRMYLHIRPAIYWTSTQCDEKSAWSISFGAGNINCYGKYYANYVRSVAAF